MLTMQSKAQKKSKSTSRPKLWGSASYVLTDLRMLERLWSSSMRTIRSSTRKTRINRMERTLKRVKMTRWARIWSSWYRDQLLCRASFRVAIGFTWFLHSSVSIEMLTFAWRLSGSNVRWQGKTFTSEDSLLIHLSVLRRQRRNLRLSSLSLVRLPMSSWCKQESPCQRKALRRSSTFGP